MRLGKSLRILTTLALAFALGAPAVRAADPTELRRADAAIGAWDLPAARQAIDAAPPGVPTEVKRGVLLVYEGRYAEAEKVLAEAVASGELVSGSEAEEEAKHFLALARGSQKALGAPVEITSDDGHVVAVFADPKDAILAPYLFEAMASARAALGDELGVLPDHAVRFEFLDDPTKLAMVTPLTVENIRTTGTVGVTKYRRIMMITPRVMLYGYGWIDTAVHEYVHYLLTIRTRNHAPVWLQEGMAKLLEARWRRADPEPLDSAIAHRLHQAIVRDDLVTFAEMYPSVAMLPSADRAALAYAEVETMLGLVRERRGRTGIELLLDRVATGADAESALEQAWGDDFDAFMTEWKRVMQRRTAGGEAGEIDRPTFKDDADAPPPEALGDVFGHLGGGRARQHARLGTLLQARGHKAAAAIQYEKARAVDARARRDPALSKRLGRLHVELGDYGKAVPLLDIAAKGDPEDANLAAAQGRALLRSGNTARAKEALWRAIRVNPFIPALHCDLAILSTDEVVAARERAQCDE